MKGRFLIVMLTLAALAATLGACRSPVEEITGTITISLGATGARSTAWPPDDATKSKLVHKITLTGPGGTKDYELKNGDMALHISVVPGTWTIKVEAFLDGVLYAKAAETVDIQAGVNKRVTLIMSRAAYAVTMSSSNNNHGTASADPASAIEGETVTITAAPKVGYMFEEWLVTGMNVSALSPNDTTTPAHFTMPAANVTIEAVFKEVPASTPVLNLSAVHFDNVAYGYAQPAAQIVTITNTGSAAATVSQITAVKGEGANTYDFVLSGETSIVETSIAVGASASFTVQPAPNLAIGTYTATLLVDYTGGVVTTPETAKAELHFTVNPATPNKDLFNIAGEWETTVGDPFMGITVTAHNGTTTGAITIYYEGTGSTTYAKSTTRPEAAGTYAVTFGVAAAGNWAAATGLVAGTLTISAAPPYVPPEAGTANDPYKVANATDWNNIASFISGSGDNKTYFISITQNFTRTSNTDPTFGNVTGLNVTINGVGENRTITLEGTGNLLRVRANQTVTMGGLTLRGNSGNNTALVYVDSSSNFTMNSGKISDNKSSNSSYGGGVFVTGTYSSPNTNHGVFTMNGGEVSDNEAPSGGGVFVNSFGSFIMRGDAKVADNRANGTSDTTGRGGGVYLTGSTISGTTTTFTMEGGEISGNEATGTSTPYGGGVVVSGSTAAFTMAGGTVSGNKATGSGSAYGGGVAVITSGTVRISNGTIYGSNETNTTLQNTANSSGAALYINGNGSTVQYGTFSGTGNAWVSKGNLATTDDTIRVANGELVTVFTVDSETSWSTAATYITNNGGTNINHKSYLIYVTASFSIPGITSYTFQSNNIDVTIVGTAPNLAISLAAGTTNNGNLLFVKASQTVIVENLTLRGRADNSQVLVRVEGATANFTMNNGRIIANQASVNGGGVVIGNGGTFTMSGDSTISGNTATGSGGGVCVSDGTFNMRGGSIQDNHIDAPNGYGGGVFVGAGGVFRLENGTIHGTGINGIENTAPTDAALSVLSDGEAARGVFVNGEWERKEDLETTSDTIRVVNGELAP